MQRHARPLRTPLLKAWSIVLASGTLAPLDSFAGELRLPFHVQLEAPHVVDMRRQVSGPQATQAGHGTELGRSQYDDGCAAAVCRKGAAGWLATTIVRSCAVALALKEHAPWHAQTAPSRAPSRCGRACCRRGLTAAC